MNARDVPPSRLEAAKAQGRRLIDGLRPGDELAIIAAGAQPRVTCGTTDHQRTLREALESIPSSDGPTRIPDAVTLARRLLTGTEKGQRIIVLTDAGFDGAADLARQEDVELIGVGQKTGNVGITRLQARRSLIDPIGYEILVEVANASDDPVSLRLELDLEDDPIDVVPLNLKPGERTVQVFEKTSAEGGRLRAHLDRRDDFAADDTAWAILPRRASQKVTLVGRGNLFLEKVFEAIPLVDLEVVKIAEGQNPTAQPAKASGGANQPVVVYHRTIPDALPTGDIIVIDPERSGAMWELGEPLHNPIVAKQDKDSPVMAHIRLDNVTMPEARKLTFTGSAHVLAESAAGDPLYALVDRPAGQGKVIVLTVDLDKSDLPLQTAFPIMMTNALSEFRGSKGELRESVPAGAVVEVVLPPEGDPAVVRALRAPDGHEQPLVVPEGVTKVAVGPLDRCGVWSIVRRSQASPAMGAPATVKGSGDPDVLAELACNLADRRESDLRPAEGIPERATNVAAGLAVRPIWYYLLASAWLLTCWEWFLYQRRWID
jgi:hypothetical protein